MNRRGLTDPRRYGRIANDRNSRQVGCSLFEKLKSFSAHVVIERGETGGVAARPR